MPHALSADYILDPLPPLVRAEPVFRRAYESLDGL
jgi:hypothetical protein